MPIIVFVDIIVFSDIPLKMLDDKIEKKWKGRWGQYPGVINEYLILKPLFTVYYLRV